MERPTLTKLNEKARQAVLKGVNAIYEPVRLTLGPEGGNALMYRTYNRGPRITNDGVTIAEVIEPKDEFEQLSASAFKEAAKRTNEKAGDGTTTTIVIAGKLINDLFSRFSQGSTIRSANAGGKTGVMHVRKELMAAAQAVEEQIKNIATPIKELTDLEKIATVSVEDPTLGKTIADMVWQTGTEGYVDVIEGHKDTIETEVIKGMRFPAKVAAKAFVNNPARYEMVAQDTPVIVTNYALDNAAQVNAFTSHLNTAKLAIFAPSFSENVLVALVAAFKQGFHVYPIATPALRTEQYEDLAAYCGASFINKDTGKKLENIRPQDMGSLEKVIVKDNDAKEDAVATGGKGETTEQLTDRIDVLKKQMEEAPSELQKKILERRIASMASAIGVIRVGASSQAEGLYLKLKIEDAVYACKAALEEGYVKGGGLCLKEIAETLPETILTPALKAPYEQIQANAEEELTIGEDIIDPAKSMRLAVEHAVSVAAHLATVKIIIPEMREQSPAEGYNEIAKSLMTYVSFWARQQGLIKENDAEAAKDMLARYEEEGLTDR